MRSIRRSPSSAAGARIFRPSSRCWTEAGKSNFPDVSSSIEEHRHAFGAHQLGPIVLRVVQRRDIHRLLGLKQRFRRDVAVIAVPQRHHAPGLSLLEKLDRKPAERKAPHPRSAEHTSELQSLLRISYAVFCLKKKKSKT